LRLIQEGEAETAALLWLRNILQLDAVSLTELLGDVKSKAGSLDAGGEEGGEDLPRDVRRNAWSVVVDLDDHATMRGVSARVELDMGRFRAMACMLQCVVAEV